jgi:hypothetical protein
MAREIILEDQKNSIAYRLKPVLFPHEPHQGEYPVTISGSLNPIEGHFLIRLYQYQDESSIEEIVGIAHSEQELPDKVYQCALEAGRKYAEKLKCRFVDETTRAKEGKLASLATE